MKRKRTFSNRSLSNRVNSRSQSKKGNEIQDDSGVLKDSVNAENHPFEKSIEPLEISDIDHALIIPDFIDPTRSPYPIVVRSPSTLQCIDGWEKVEKAKSKGESTLTCEIIHIQLDSEIEVAIWKATVRIMPLGGPCSYPEKMANTCRLFSMLLESKEDPVVFSHGGARRGDTYENKRKNNIRIVLAERLGKSITTINKYLQHAKYLSEETLQTLINAGVQKGFFEAIQQSKQVYATELELAKTPSDEIVRRVSTKVLDWLKKSRTPVAEEIIASVCPDPTSNASNAGESQVQSSSGQSPATKPIEYKHWAGNPAAALERQQTEDEIYHEFIAIGNLLIETAENKAMSVQDRVQTFHAQIIRQTRLIQQLKNLIAQQNINEEESC